MLKKGALALLSGYGGDSSDEEVPGPRVSTKRVSKDEEIEEYSKKRLQRLPIPEALMQVNKNSEHIDDPNLHDGRVRSFAHERGNWATFIYIPYEAQIGITQLLSSIQEMIPEHMNIKISDDFHISLTKTVILKYHWIPSFVEGIKAQLGGFRRFVILFDNVKIYCNEERTRTFIGIQIKSGHDTLLKLVETLDRCLDDFKLPPFYKDPSFHMSIAWYVGDLEKELQRFLPEINKKMEQLMQEYVQDTWYILVDRLACKIGNKYFQFLLN